MQHVLVMRCEDDYASLVALTVKKVECVCSTTAIWHARHMMRSADVTPTVVCVVFQVDAKCSHCTGAQCTSKPKLERAP